MNLQAQGVPVAVSVNGTAQTSSVEPGLLLVDYLRDTLGLSGTKVGCETGQCGMCTVLLDGASVKSCAVLAAQTNGHSVITIEGLSPNGVLTPIQEKLWEMHAVQCGYCTPGMVVALTELLQRNAKPSEAEIRESLDGIMCRCGVYQNAIRAVQSVVATAGGG